MSPKHSTIQEIMSLLDSVQEQLQQIRLRAKELAELVPKETKGEVKP